MGLSGFAYGFDGCTCCGVAVGVGASELAVGGHEVLAEPCSLGEAHTHVLDVGGFDLLGLVLALAGEGGAEGTEVAEAQRLAFAHEAQGDVLQGVEHGLHIGRGDGGSHADDFDNGVDAERLHLGNLCVVVLFARLQVATGNDLVVDHGRSVFFENE